MVGKKIDNFKIIKHIGTGGMGTVYLAEDMMLGRKIAVKMLHSELLYKKDILERFKTEAKTLAKLNHPNIAILFNLIESSGNYFMIMEYVDGDSLETLLIQNGAFIANEAIDITIQALEGIEHAHYKKIIHRDLKPANLMLNQEGTVKVMDFGIARALGSTRMTREGSVVGTLEYMAPEQIRGQEGDERSDIYAMGIVLYELLTGNVPYRSKSDYDLMTKKLTQKPPEIRSFWHEIPKSLEKVVMKAIKKDQELRFQSAEQFKLALKECKTDLSVVKSKKEKEKSVPVISASSAKSENVIMSKLLEFIPDTKHLVNTSALVVLIIIIGISAYFLRQKRLENNSIADVEKTEISNNLLVQKTGDNGVSNDESSVPNSDFESGRKLNLDGFNNDNSQKKNEDKREKHKKKAKTKEEKKINSSKKNDNKNKTKNVKNNQKSKADDKKKNDSGLNKITDDSNNKKKNKPDKKMKIVDDSNKKKTEKKNNQDNSSTKKQNRVLNTYIRKNMPIIVYLPEKISSLDNTREGESLVLYVDKDYREDGIVIIPGGTKVYCSINEIKKGDGRKRGTIEIEAQYIQTSDGTRIPLKESVFRYVGQRGKNVTFKKGQKFKVKTAKKTNLTVNY